MYAAMGLALLTKGPVGVLVPAAGIAAYLGLAGGWRRVAREARPLAGTALVLAIAAPWYGAMLWEHGADYAARARGETLGRVFRTVTGPGGTVLFYVPVLLLGFFPWSAFLPGALASAVREARAGRLAERGAAAAVFAAAWVLAILVLFSLFRSRLPHYVAPLVPAAALLVAAAWPSRVPTLARALLGALGLVVGGTLLALPAMEATITRLLAAAYPADPGAGLSGGVPVMGALALAMGAAALVRDGERLFSLLAVLSALFIAVGLHVVLPAFSAEFVAPAGRLVAGIAPALRPCDDLAAVGPYRPSLVFYARRPVQFVDLRHPDRLAALAAARGRLFVVAPRAAIPALPGPLAALPELDARGGYVVLASPPTDRACR
jgi:4-amino-4-deoxy-L-arabinose transferase-like glycosyltransferase